MYYNAVAYYAYLGGVGNFAFKHIAACDEQFGNCNQLADFHASGDNFFKFRRKHAFDSSFNVVNSVVNNPVSTYVNLFGFSSLACVGVWADVKADNQRVGRGCQHYVGFGNGAYAGVNNDNLNFIVFNVGKRRFQCFDSALNVCFDNNVQFVVFNVGKRRFQRFDSALNVCLNNNVQFFQLAFLNTLENIVQRYFGVLLHFFAAAFCKAFFGNAAGSFFVRELAFLNALEDIIQRHFGVLLHFFAAAFGKAFFRNAAGSFFIRAVKDIACHRHFVQAKHFDRSRWQRFFNFFAAVVNHGAHFAVSRACNNGIADA